ncbi:hypothetical protein [Mesorhizobium sp.]|uniref:hypothetical protein n=1 Tax=Mesorhizobium sp. TaxID=1871066 RepID=UPI000FE39FA2|nr:hypothetical protein [Mesorhizobium sp.]RWG91425.1 MAG: hypothetical protein EOQ70_00010 [Mesorhizobium sp.]RWK22562.1 MAG: hypothetical protein EOR41_00200 [Mesorhizobium sp.]
MTLDQFRNTRLPGEDDAQPVCSGDENLRDEAYESVRVQFKVPFGDVGGVTCMFATNIKGDIFPAFLDFANTTTQSNYFYFYKPRSGGDYVLFCIEVGTAEVSKFEKISAAYVQKFGQPASVDVKDVQNGFGAVFQNVIVTFQNNSSVIRLTKFDGSLDKTTAFYWLKSIVREINSIRDAADKTAKKL